MDPRVPGFFLFGETAPFTHFRPVSGLREDPVAGRKRCSLSLPLLGIPWRLFQGRGATVCSYFFFIDFRCGGGVEREREKNMDL